jgi:acyl-CoA reductase-like NAD-dependent aldehyde dehydrogenase
LINSRGAEKVQEQVHEALEKGARLHCGGSAIDATHFEPTLLSDVAADASCFSSETFGPLCAIRGFDSEEEILALANASPFGLAGYFFSTGLFLKFGFQQAYTIFRSSPMFSSCRKARSWHGWNKFRSYFML